MSPKKLEKSKNAGEPGAKRKSSKKKTTAPPPPSTTSSETTEEMQPDSDESSQHSKNTSSDSSPSPPPVSHRPRKIVTDFVEKTPSRQEEAAASPPPPPTPQQEPEEMEEVPYMPAPQSSQHRPPKEPQPRPKPKRVITVPRGRGRGRGRGRAQHGGRQDEEEDELQIIINDEQLISMMEARPPLWDANHPHHAKRSLCATLWQEIYAEICPCWEDLSRQEKFFVADRIKTRWHSIRDRHIRDLREEEHLPSGSAPPAKSLYVNRHLLGFLQKSDQLRGTHSSTSERRQRAAPEPSSPPPPSPHSDPTPVPPPADQGQPSSPLPASSSARPIRQGIERAFGELVRQLRPGRRQEVAMLDLSKITKESLLRLDDKLERMREVFDRLRLAGAEAATGPPSANLIYLQSMAPLLDTLPLDKQMTFRQETSNLLRRLCCPPPTPTPTPQTPPPRPTPPPQSHSPAFSISSETSFQHYRSPSRRRSPSRTHSRHHSPTRTHYRHHSPTRTHSRHHSRPRSRSPSRQPSHHYTPSSRQSHPESRPHSQGHFQHLGYFPPTQSTPMAQMLSQGDYSTPSQHFPLPPNVPTPSTPFPQFSSFAQSISYSLDTPVPRLNTEDRQVSLRPPEAPSTRDPSPPPNPPSFAQL